MSQNETEPNRLKSVNSTLKNQILPRVIESSQQQQRQEPAMVPNKINKEKMKQKQQAQAASLKINNNKKEGHESKKGINELDENDDDESMKQMVGGCCVCADDTGSANNLLVYCDGCDVAVHQGCYGIINVPDGDWFCRRCEAMRKNDVKYDKLVSRFFGKRKLNP